MSGWGSGAWGSSPWGTGEDEDTESLTGVQLDLSQVVVLAKDMVKLVFSVPVKNDDVLQAVSSFQINALDVNNSLPVTITKVQTGTKYSTRKVVLIISPPSPGATYTVTVDGDIRSLDDQEIVENVVVFKSRTTKSQNIVESRPTMYDTRPKALIRTLLGAIGQEDDKIGGSQEEGEDIHR